MKFSYKTLNKILILSLIILFSFIHSSTSEKKRKHKTTYKYKNETTINVNKEKSKSNDSSYSSFLKGFAEQFRVEKKELDSCVSIEWKNGKSYDDEKSLASFENPKENFFPFNNLLKENVESNCQHVGDIKTFMKKKLGLIARRRFYQKGKKELTYFDKIAKKLEKFYNNLKEILNSPMSANVDLILACLKSTNSSTGVKLKSENYLKNKKKILESFSKFIDFIIEIFCDWKNFKSTMNFYENGVKTKDIFEKWLNYGKFIGSLVHKIGL